MTTISIDFETRSTIDLRKTGVYPYAEHPTTDIWCMAFAIDDGPVKVWSPFVPESNIHVPRLFEALPGAELRAWNAGFEHIIWRMILAARYGFPRVEAEQWTDTAAEAAAMALPRSLAGAADVLNLGVEKDDEGYKLMMKMCKPRCVGAYWVGEAGPFATKAEAVAYLKSVSTEVEFSQGTGIHQDDHTVMWWDDPADLNRLALYCKQDVEVERKIAGVLRPLPPTEVAVYHMNQRMNDRGIGVDTELVAGAQDIMTRATADATMELQKLTGGAVEKVTQVANIRSWMEAQGMVVDNLRKDTVRDLLAGDDITDPVIRRVLEIRRDVGKSSTGKLDAFERCVASDGRVHGLLMYHGASTGRWAGALVQPQNFPRPEDFCTEECLATKGRCICGGVERFIEWVVARDYATLEEMTALKGQSVPSLIASMLRSMLRASEGHVLMAADYSQIEARILAWIAGQEDLVELFRSGGKVYETMAAFIFGMRVEDVAKDSFERQIGKNSVLGAGFQMGPDRFAEQVQEQTGIVLDRGEEWWQCYLCGRKDFEEGRPLNGTCGCKHSAWEHEVRPDLAKQAIDGYRTLYPMIPAFWRDINDAAIAAVRDPGSVHRVGVGATIKFSVRGQFLWCRLPSGRYLAYAMPSLHMRPLPEPYEDIVKLSLRYHQVNPLTKQWGPTYTYGGHLTENVVQAMARDLMAEAMLRVEGAGFHPVLTVHDEVVVEARTGADYQDFMRHMRHVPGWAGNLPVAAEGWVGERYRK